MADLETKLLIGGEHAEILRAANVPPSFVILQRINLGLYAIFGELRATARASDRFSV